MYIISNPSVNSNCSYSPETINWGKKTGDFCPLWTWPSKILGHLFYTMSSVVHYFISIGEFKLELWSGNSKFKSKSAIFVPWGLKLWLMTLKNNRAALLSHIKLCASFHRHMWIETGVRVRKQLNWALTLRPWPLTFDLGLLHGHHFCHW